MTRIALLFATPSASHQNVTQAVLSQRMLFVMLNARSQNVRLNAQTKDVRCLTVPNVLLYANNLTVWPTARHQNPSASLYARNLDVIGNVTSLTAQNQNANWSAKIQTAFQKSNAVPALWVHQELHNLSHSLKKQKQTNNVVNAKSNEMRLI